MKLESKRAVCFLHSHRCWKGTEHLLVCLPVSKLRVHWSFFFPAPCLSRKWNLSRTNIKTKKFIKSHFCSRINIQTQTRRVALNFKNLISYYFFLIHNNLKNLLQARYLLIDILILPLILDRKRAYLKKFQPLSVNRWIQQRCCQSKKIWHNFCWQHRRIVHEFSWVFLLKMPQYLQFWQDIFKGFYHRSISSSCETSNKTWKNSWPHCESSTLRQLTLHV